MSVPRGVALDQEEPDACDRTVVFRLKDTGAVEGWSGADAATLRSRSLQNIVDRVQKSVRADSRLSSLYLTPNYIAPENNQWKLAFPFDSGKFWDAGVNIARFDSVDEAQDAASILSEDQANIADVQLAERFRFSPAVGHANRSFPGTVAGWHRAHCKFDIAKQLDTPGEFRSIGIIDAGLKGLQNPDLTGRIESSENTTFNPPRQNHAAMVAGVISALRNNPSVGNPGMDGCCSARLRVYSVMGRLCHARGDMCVDYKMMHRAMQDIATHLLPVVNMSFSGPVAGSYTRAAIQELFNADVAVVAAMGDENTNEDRFPAAIDGVIAVGAVDQNNRPIPNANRGNHLKICAPGADIWTVIGDGNMDFGWDSGSSFATPMVSAAIWLARKNRKLSLTQVSELIVRSGMTHTSGHNPTTGNGCLSMELLAQNLWTV